MILFQELENTFDGWTGDLAHLTVLRESLSCYISAEDLSVLQERIELLHRQWDEICHQVQQSATAEISSQGDLDFLRAACSLQCLQFIQVSISGAVGLKTAMLFDLMQMRFYHILLKVQCELFQCGIIS